MANNKSLTISVALFNCIKEDRKKLYIHLCSTIIENKIGVLNLSNKFLDTQYLCISLRLYSVGNKDGRWRFFLSGHCLHFISLFERFYEELSSPFHLSLSFFFSLSFYFSLSLLLSFSLSISPSLSLLSIFLSGVSNGRFRPCYYL